jgi:hypothetical protein
MKKSLSSVKNQDRYAQSKHPSPNIGYEKTSKSGAKGASRDRFVFDGLTFVRLLSLSNLLAGTGFRSLQDFRSPFCFAR